MRSHSQVIKDAGGCDVVRQRLQWPANRTETVKSWLIRNSIPAHYWLSLSRCRVATLTELAEAAESREQLRKAG